MKTITLRRRSPESAYWDVEAAWICDAWLKRIFHIPEDRLQVTLTFQTVVDDYDDAKKYWTLQFTDDGENVYVVFDGAKIDTALEPVELDRAGIVTEIPYYVTCE